MLTRNEVRSLRTKLEASLARLGPELGFKLTLGDRVTFSSVANFKLFAAPLNASGVPETTKEQADFNKYCGRYGLARTDFGKTFKIGSIVYTIVGIRPKGRRFPITLQRSDNPGRLTKATADFVRGNLKLKDSK